MFNKKSNIVVAITTSDFDALRISVPPLRALRRRFTLVIHNDNPNQKLTPHMVRKLGWRGRMHIINSEKNLGELESKLNLVEFIRDKKIPCDWIMIANDTDVVIDVEIPNVDNNTFAIVHNAVTIFESVADIFKISPKWVNGAPIGKTGPHFDIVGTMIRADILFEFSEFIRQMLPDIYKMLSQTKSHVPASTLLWAGLNTFMHGRHPEMSPIYMNTTNYVAIKIGQMGPVNVVVTKAVSAITKKFAKIIEIGTSQNMVAEEQ